MFGKAFNVLLIESLLICLAFGDLLIADSTNYKIQKIDGRTFQPSYLAGTGQNVYKDGPQIAAGLCPWALFTDLQGGIIFADSSGRPRTDEFLYNSVRIRRLYNGQVTTLAGSASKGKSDGVGTFASFDDPRYLVQDPSDNTIYVSDFNNHRVRALRLEVSGLWNVTTLAGSVYGFLDGFGTNARFDTPRGIAVNGDLLFLADSNNNVIRTISTKTAEVTTFCGTGERSYKAGPCKTAAFTYLNGLTMTNFGVLFVSDAVRVMAIDLKSMTLDVLAGDPKGEYGQLDGIGTSARMFAAPNIVFEASTNLTYFNSFGNGLIRSVSSRGLVKTIFDSTRYTPIWPYALTVV